MTSRIQGNFVDILKKAIFFGEMEFGEKIVSIKEIASEKAGMPYILPGFIDAHVHIESSMLIPSEFARLAVVHGTVATISDPHEIANVCGKEGVEYMLENGKTVPFKFHFGAPSCVPATAFETAGAALNATDVEELLCRDDIYYLSEMMDFPGVLNENEEVMAKINAAKRRNKPVDGHAPGLRGEKAQKYARAGISTDHECFTREEALDKLRAGMKILIREGSAAKNFNALISLLNDYPNEIMFCSDDKHPDSLVKGHINELCKRSVEAGVDVFKVLKAACINPVEHYQMKVGQLNVNDSADFILVEDLRNFRVIKTYINGTVVAKEGKTKIESVSAGVINNFHCSRKTITDFEIAVTKEGFPVIEALDGELITNKLDAPIKEVKGKFVSDIDSDILKLAVVNRYEDAPVAVGFIKNFGLKKGAIASSVAHDSHNIIAVGVNDESICRAVNLIIAEKGGISVTDFDTDQVLPLPVAGLMSNANGYSVAEQYTAMDTAAKKLGSQLTSPFMTLSFMALLVIPSVKLSDKGLFNGETFQFFNANG